MSKTIKISRQSEIEPQIPYEHVFSKRIITNKKDNSDRMSFNHVKIKAGWEHMLSNDDKDEIVYFIDGKAIISFEDEKIEVTAGSCVYIPAGCEWKYFASEDATMVCVYSPPAE